MNKLFCDVLIVGAGITGSALALRLAQCGIKIVMIDRQHLMPTINSTVPNSRVSAINYNSVQFFKQINIWQHIPNRVLTPYFYMKTWECPSAVVTFNINSLGISNMGYTVENNRLKLALWKNMLDSELITFYCSSELVSLKYDGKFWRCVLNNNTIIIGYLLIGADGTYSQIRNKINVDIISWKCHQHCMLLTIKTERNMNGTIWQVFTPSGPIGFLPLYDNWGSLMWFDTPDHINKLKYLPKLMLEKIIENNFHKELGHVILYNIATIPLINQRACKYTGIRSVLIGDAAHTIHPLAGQGINLGIRDVMRLSELLIQADIFNINLSILDDILLSYQDNRRYDIYLMQSGINWLYWIFHNDILPLKITRNLVFMIVNKSNYIKTRLLKYAVLGI